MKKPLISIVIPCYNHGQYIDDAIKSVEEYFNDNYEIIIINDGSTDEYTNARLIELKNEGYNVIFQENQGLSKTRNNGIRIAKGKYILPLDADNKIKPEYIIRAIEILDKNSEFSVVYGDAELFGDREGRKSIGAFDIKRLLNENFIDACAVFRKSAWERCGGYNSNMIYGWEDWDFWLNLFEMHFKFYYIPEVVFLYRFRENSMMRLMDHEKQKYLRNIIFLNHLKLYAKYHFIPKGIYKLEIKITIKVWFWYFLYNPPINKRNSALLYSLIKIAIRQKIAKKHPEISINNPLWNSFKYILKKKTQFLKS